ncbi:MAG TPA: bifunctional diaminohydroxyphosphoribosylaminopyrimidine deaminase/5-amino-6-(5-phosphoribosylamino)uracil reductase RibD [Abditibacteriaceae bacterium]|jgi:diaminohydroxyphosphoribosylaminopyrimidine deaminase/5-amino-6-(5-phosphoribosylamino)uracil reductase
MTLDSPIDNEIRDDKAGMRAALAWSARGRGQTSPRPSVGAVIVQDGRVIGGGHTQRGDGNPHAEVMALRAARDAGFDTRGATAYVTLEPCSHFRSTPPCTSALIEAGVARVVCGVRDPNPAVNGQGHTLLRAAGIEVVEAFMEAECARAQDHFLVHIAENRPFITLKCAVSLDGKIATQTGESQWISSETSRRRGHEMRADHDAILVGVETVLADDPRLSVRLENNSIPFQPARVVLDSRGRLAEYVNHIRLFAGSTAEDTPLYVATSRALSQDNRDVLEAHGATVLVTDSDDLVNIHDLWQQLYARDICSVLVEGGARVAGAVLASGTVDKVQFFVAPLLIGGDGLNAVAGFGIEALSSAPRLCHVQIEQMENDVAISGYTRRLPGMCE